MQQTTAVTLPRASTMAVIAVYVSNRLALAAAYPTKTHAYVQPRRLCARQAVAAILSIRTTGATVVAGSRSAQIIIGFGISLTMADKPGRLPVKQNTRVVGELVGRR